MALADAIVNAAIQYLATIRVAGDFGAAASKGLRLAARTSSARIDRHDQLSRRCESCDEFWTFTYIFILALHGGQGPG